MSSTPGMTAVMHQHHAGAHRAVDAEAHAAVAEVGAMRERARARTPAPPARRRGTSAPPAARPADRRRSAPARPPAPARPAPPARGAWASSSARHVRRTTDSSLGAAAAGVTRAAAPACSRLGPIGLPRGWPMRGLPSMRRRQPAPGPPRAVSGAPRTARRRPGPPARRSGAASDRSGRLGPRSAADAGSSPQPLVSPRPQRSCHAQVPPQRHPVSPARRRHHGRQRPLGQRARSARRDGARAGRRGGPAHGDGRPRSSTSRR